MTTPQEVTAADVEKANEKGPTPAQYEPSLVPAEGTMEDKRVHLGWRTWVVVFVSGFLA